MAFIQVSENHQALKHRPFPLLSPLICLILFFTAYALQAKDSATIRRIEILKKAAAHNLAPVHTLIPSIEIELKYASTDNFTKRALYPPDMPCLLHHMTLKRLKKAQKILKRQKLHLKIWDAYRPPIVHRLLWKYSKSATYLVPPEMGLSLHCYGVAVDVTLVDSQGNELTMPSAHDTFSPEASSTYRGGNDGILRNLSILQKAMKQAGFSTIEDEWWHFTNMEPAAARTITAQQLGIQLPSDQPLKAKIVSPSYIEKL